MARKRKPRAKTRRTPSRGSRRGGRFWTLVVLLAAALAGLAWWRLLAVRVPEQRMGGLGVDRETANRTALALGRQGRHQESIPYFREVVRQDPGSGIAHENLGSALGNGAQQVRTHLGKTDNANRSSVERIAMLKETIAETERARQLARTDPQRVYSLLEQGRTLYTWGFPIDALDRMRAAYEIAPNNPAVERSFHGLEHELATGKRP
jgi:tetratricopeptide (TPR) repeat protein